MGAAAHLNEATIKLLLKALSLTNSLWPTKGSLNSACDGQEGWRLGRRGASMQEAGASEVGGACRLGWVRVHMRAADLAPLAGVASATETRRNRAGAAFLGACPG